MTFFSPINTETTRRLLKFAVVGASGVIVNEVVTMLFLLLLGGVFSQIIRTNASVFMGWFFSVLSNYLLNYHWTWKDRINEGSGSVLSRVHKYYMSAIVAFFVQALTVNVLASFFGWSVSKVLMWNLIGIGGGTIVNFMLADKWVFNNRRATNYGLWAVLFVILLTSIKLFYVQNVGLVADEAYYWEWSRRLALSYFDHPPMVAYLIALTTKLFGDTTTAIRLGAIVLAGATSLLIYDLGRQMLSARTAFAAMAVLNSTLIFFVGSLIITPDTPQIFFWALGINLCWRALHRRNLGHWILGGAAVGLGLLSKYTFVLFIPSLFLFLILSRDDRHWLKKPGPYLMAICAFLVFLPVIIWNYQQNWVSFAFQLNHGLGNTKTASLRWLADFLAGQTAMVSPVLFVAFLGAIGIEFIKGMKSHRKETLFLSTFSAFVFFFFLLISLRSKVEANWPVPAYLTGFLLLSCSYDRNRRKWKYAPLLAGFGVTLSIVITSIALAQVYFPFLPLEAGKNPVARTMGWHQLASRVEAHRSTEGQLLPVVTDRYQYSALLAYYLPDHPETYTLAPHRRAQQYEVWNQYDKLTSQDVLYITNTPAIHCEVKRYFSSTQFLEHVEITWQHKQIRSFYIFRCTGFKGFTRRW